MFIYHIVLPEIWEEVRSEPLYRHESLAAEGFIHCSYEGQLDGVIGRYYADRARIFRRAHMERTIIIQGVGL